MEDGFELTTRALDGVHRYAREEIVLAIGAMHRPNLLGIPGEDLPHVSHYFHDPHTYFAKQLLIVGGRNSAIEAAVRCQRAGAHVTLSYRREDFDPATVKFWLLPEDPRHDPRRAGALSSADVPLEIGKGTVRMDSTA